MKRIGLRDHLPVCFCMSLILISGFPKLDVNTISLEDKPKSYFSIPTSRNNDVVDAENY
jgi:hypothetical protein